MWVGAARLFRATPRHGSRTGRRFVRKPTRPCRAAGTSGASQLGIRDATSTSSASPLILHQAHRGREGPALGRRDRQLRAPAHLSARPGPKLGLSSRRDRQLRAAAHRSGAFTPEGRHAGAPTGECRLARAPSTSYLEVASASRSSAVAWCGAEQRHIASAAVVEDSRTSRQRCASIHHRPLPKREWPNLPWTTTTRMVRSCNADGGLLIGGSDEYRSRPIPKSPSVPDDPDRLVVPG
jgi:hypothetical protein